MSGAHRSNDKTNSSVNDHNAASRLGRRRFLQAAGLGIGAATLLGASAASAADSQGPDDATILNFALNLQYLAAEFYSVATTGTGLPDELTNGVGTKGPVTGGRAVNFKTPQVKQYAQELAKNELNHVKFLRTALGAQAVARPAIDLAASFAAAAAAAGVSKDGQTFDPYQNEQLFLWAAYVFEDVWVTALKGAVPLLANKAYVSAAAGMLAAEAYNASLIRSTLYGLGQPEPSELISKARNSLDGVGNDDQGFVRDGAVNIVPADENGLVFGRTPERVLNIVYLTPNVAAAGGFFPNGVNGSLKQSGGAPGAVPGPNADKPAPNNAPPAPNAVTPPAPPAASTPASIPSAAGATTSAPNGAVGVGVTPTGGAATGAGGTAGGRDVGLLVGGAFAAVGAVATAGGYQRNRKLATDAVYQGED